MRPLGRARGSADRAAVALDDRLHDPQPEPQPPRLRLLVAGPRRKRSKSGAASPSRQARTLVLHPERERGRRRTAPPTRIGVPSRRELVGVGEQVDEHLGQPRRVAVDERQRLGQRDLERLAALGEERRRSALAPPRPPRRAPRAAGGSPSWPDSMRTLSSRLSMSCVSRSVPRSSESTSSRGCVGPAWSSQAVAQQLDRGELGGERRAELVRDVGEHRVARAAHGLELGLVAHHLHLQALDRRARW